MRVIFPPFQHKSGVTELDHAIDARAIDDAFADLANTLNGGIDESNLSAGVKFSTLTPGGVNVNTALAQKYSVVTMSRGRSSGAGLSLNIPLGVVVGAGWIPWRGFIVVSGSSAAPVTVDFKKNNATSLSGTLDSIRTDNVDAALWEFSGYDSFAGSVADGDRIGVTVTAFTTPATVRAVSLSFLVPVL